jgi:tetratricopeptide (TPR) repeat protein
VKYRAAKGIPPSFEGFRSEVGRQGFDHAAEVYAAMRKDKPDFTFEEGALYSWSQELVSDNHLPEAIALLKLNVQLNPDSAGDYFDLGEAYLKSGQKQLALENYRKSLEKEPDNDDVKQKIKDLENSSAAPAPR